MRPFLIAAAFVAALPAHAGDVTVFAAASLKTALDLIAADFTTKTGDRVAISYAGSGQLARQIIAGAPADLARPTAACNSRRAARTTGFQV